MTHDGLFRPWSQPADRSMLRPLRPYQAGAIAQIREAIREGHRRIMVMAPTGAGKTLLAASIIHGALAKGKKVLFSVPSIALCEKTLDDFEKEGILDIGVIQAQNERSDWFAPVQIASVQSLIRRRDWPFDLAFIDEAHEQYAGLNERLDGPAWAQKIIIGLSATPFSKGLGRHWTKLVTVSTLEDLIDEGYMSKFRVYAPAVDVDLSKVRITAGDFNEAELSDVMSDGKLVADIVKTWKERGNNEPTFAFCVTRAHAASLQEEFRQAGVSCGYLDGFSTPEERLETFLRFRSGQDKIITNVGVLVRGIDEDCRVLIDAQPTRSLARHIQKLGRSLRLAPGKEIATILDHAGNCLRLGLPTDVKFDKLNTQKSSERYDCSEPGDKPVPKPRKCKNCGCVMPPRSRQCPACGHAHVPSTDIVVEDGELVEFGTGKNSKKPVNGGANKQEYYSGLLYIAKERGYKDGWAANKYRAKFDVWPRGLEDRPVSPSREVTNFVLQQEIAWRAMQKKRAREVAIG